MEGSKTVLVMGKCEGTEKKKYWKWCGESSTVRPCSRRPYLKKVGVERGREA